MFEGMTLDEVRTELKKSAPPMKPEPHEVTARRLARWVREVGLVPPDAQSIPGQPIPKEMEPEEPNPKKEEDR
jgi:hypothetical protein